MTEHARDAGQCGGERRRIGEDGETTIEHEISLIGAVRLAVWIEAERRFCPEIGDLALDERARDRQQLDRDRCGTEVRHLLFAMRDRHHSARRGRKDLFAQHRTTRALDRAQRGVDLVHTVDGQVGRREIGRVAPGETRLFDRPRRGE